MNIIVDAMGGDYAPLEIVKGCVDAVSKLGVEITLVGDRFQIEQIIGQTHPNISVVHAPEVIGNHEDPVKAIRSKTEASMVVGMKLLAEGKGDAFLSAGSTGALISGATLIVKRIRGVRRVAMASVIPSANKPTLLLDCGANADCTPDFLQQFAVMGSAYAKGIWGIEQPVVGLLNNGAEEGKGNQLAKESYELLKETDIQFAGNIEGRDVLTGVVDVLVTDGFSGNVFLKTTEGTAQYFSSLLKQMLTKNIITKLCAVVLSSGIRSFKKNFDYEEHGGAPLLGASKPVFKAHGSSSAVAIYNAIRQAQKFVENQVISAIEKNL